MHEHNISENRCIDLIIILIAFQNIVTQEGHKNFKNCDPQQLLCNCSLLSGVLYTVLTSSLPFGRRILKQSPKSAVEK